MSSVAQSQEQRCKGCGLMVQAGYAKCPRCKMPQAKSAADRKAQGGTAVEGGSNLATYVALALFLVVIVVIVMARGGDEDTTPAPPDESTRPVDTPSEVAAPSQLGTDPDDTEVGFTGSEIAAEDKQGDQTVLLSLEQELGALRLWASVSSDTEEPTVVIVTSGTCGDAKMKATLQGLGGQLKATGYTQLRCVAKHGALAFELKF